jgi:hypothetical protein
VSAGRTIPQDRPLVVSNPSATEGSQRDPTVFGLASTAKLSAPSHRSNLRYVAPPAPSQRHNLATSHPRSARSGAEPQPRCVAPPQRPPRQRTTTSLRGHPLITLGRRRPRHRDTATPRHRDTATPRHRDTATPRHRDTATPRHRDTATPRQILCAGPAGEATQRRLPAGMRARRSGSSDGPPRSWIRDLAPASSGRPRCQRPTATRAAGDPVPRRRKSSALDQLCSYFALATRRSGDLCSAQIL